MPKFKYLMFTNPVKGRDAEFNTWYDDVHLPDIRATGAFRTAERFEIVASAFTAPSEYRYATIYEVEGEDADQALSKLVAAAKAGQFRMSDAFDAASGKPILLQSMGTGFNDAE